ncbi:DUF4260 domain-containing protein [Microbulbifer thermotolerans]|uniref:DUF4260 domain-containing protein n=1 Tax=Microbulbifer thermotolerans TaxID=252514 RepID=UPI000A41DEAF|nr:DUF4260 domain-containing protein [Microbulbifer thermotolerans]
MGNVVGAVRWTLRAEGAALFIAALCLYANFEFSWLTFAILFLIPDLSFLGYLINNKVGAIAYNFAHSLVGAILILGLGFFNEVQLLQLLGLIWLAHIGFDRLLGYGLKYQRGFGYTHLGLIGKAKNI